MKQTPSGFRPMGEEYAAYLRDESRTTGHAETISFPTTEQEIVEAVNACRESGSRLTVQGGRTGLAAAAVPFGGHILNLSRMDKVLGMGQTADGFTLTVQPGAVLSELRKKLAAKKFDVTGWSGASKDALGAFMKSGVWFFPPDPTEASATIGGMTACNASGARTHGYGPTRGYVTALRVVLPSGETLALRRGQVFAAGRHLTLTTEQGTTLELDLPTFTMPKTKNASGYYIEDDMDAIDLFIGSDGTLGVFSQMELRLLPMAPQVWGVTCFLPTVDDALTFTSLVRGMKLGEVSMEYFDGNALDILRRQKAEKTAFAALPTIPETAGAAIYVELHCQTEQEAAEKLFAVGDALEQAGGDREVTWVARTESDLDKLMFFRHAVPESVNMMIDERKKTAPSITKLGSDMAVPDDRLFDVMALYRRTLKEEDLESATWGHIGENHVHVNVLPRNEADYARGKALFVRWAEAVTEMGGAVSAEHGVGKLKASFLTVMYGQAHIDEMAALKYTLDPQGLLGAGNLFAAREGGRS